MNQDLFGFTATEASRSTRREYNEFNDERELPPLSADGQHLIDGRIASIMMKTMNDSLETYMQAKKEGRYVPKKDIAGEQIVYDEAKDALFEHIVWVFSLSAFDRISFDRCCAFASDEFVIDPETLRCMLSRVLKTEIRELVNVVQHQKGVKKAKELARKLSEYISCSVMETRVGS